MNKSYIVRAVTSLGGSQGIIIPSMGTSEWKIQTIVLEGSSSMFDPIEMISQKLESSLEVSVLPTGTAAGKEAYNNKEVDFILSSIDEKPLKNIQPYVVGSENVKTTDGNEQLYFAQDPLIFLFKKDSHCKKTNELYQPYTLFSVEMGKQTGQTIDGEKYKGNRKELIKIFKEGAGKLSECNFSSYSREGGKERSNLNKTFLLTPEDGVIDGFVDKNDEREIKIKLGDAVQKVWNSEKTKNYETPANKGWTNYFFAKVSNDSQLLGRRISENNWLAFKQWSRRAKPGEITFFPLSFIESNSDLLLKENIGSFLPKDPETITDFNNVEEDDEKPDAGGAPVNSKRRKYVFKKKLYLQYKRDEKDNNSVKETHKNWVKQLLLKTSMLESSAQLFIPSYYERSANNGDNGERSKTKIDVSSLFDASESKK